MERLLTITEVAVMVGVTAPTINSWYRWKRLHPEHEMAALLPDYQMQGTRKTRYWTQADVWKLTEFRSNIKQGRYGVMGDVTQKYTKSNFRNRDKNKEEQA